ncbi:MAG TPA: MOSC domain-containing protein [Acidobacteriota bacterium]|nr:MOSC domain-containing protein [Acidobacteriota bacterium]
MTELNQTAYDAMRESPKDEGTLRMIVRRPAVDAREVLETGQLDIAEGLVGDTWKQRHSPRTPDGSPHPDTQINIMNARVIALLAGSQDRWSLAGDQLFIDLDLSLENLPAGTQLEIGEALLVVTDQPHTGCKKFSERFGPDALKLVNTPEGRQLNLRGINARVVRSGRIQIGETVRKICHQASAATSD